MSASSLLMSVAIEDAFGERGGPFVTGYRASLPAATPRLVVWALAVVLAYIGLTVLRWRPER